MKTDPDDYSGPGLPRIDRNSLAGGDLNTAIRLGPDASAAWLKLARTYFHSMPVLLALDTDHDFALSPREIDHTPAALRNFVTRRAGRVTAEECGLRIDLNSVGPAMRAQLHRRFMRDHPVLAAPDVDDDGEISGKEIDEAAIALKKLDQKIVTAT